MFQNIFRFTGQISQNRLTSRISTVILCSESPFTGGPKMKRRILALLLVFAMFAVLMTGCASGKQGDGCERHRADRTDCARADGGICRRGNRSCGRDCRTGGETAAEPETLAFTDSLEREVRLPRDITRIAPSGAVATMILAAIAQECMVTVNATPSESQMAFLPANLASLPRDRSDVRQQGKSEPRDAARCRPAGRH